MAEAGFTVIRVGESVWSTWEPEDGRFELDWLQPVLDGAHARGIARHPRHADVRRCRRGSRASTPRSRRERATGAARSRWGHRQDVDYIHPRSAATPSGSSAQVVGRYAEHPAVIGYQVDNEPGMRAASTTAAPSRASSTGCASSYGDVETLNERWGLVYWSHRIARWDELWTPDGNTVPSYDLAWRRYQAALTTDFIAGQAAIVRELARPGPVRHDVHGATRARRSTAPSSTASLDIAAVNPYYADAGRR